MCRLGFGRYRHEQRRAIGALDLTPAISIQKPADLVVASGSELLSVAVTGNPKLFAYSWRRNLGSIVVNTNSGDYGTNFVTLNTVSALLNLTNTMQSTNFQMRIVVYNDANRAPGATTTFNITVLADTDRDGIPDIIELGLGLDTNNVADAEGDLDNDGMNNRAEFVAGTDPTNSLSYLRIEENIVQGLAAVQFAAISNRTYSVQYTTRWAPSRGSSCQMSRRDRPTSCYNWLTRIGPPIVTTASCCQASLKHAAIAYLIDKAGLQRGRLFHLLRPNLRVLADVPGLDFAVRKLQADARLKTIRSRSRRSGAGARALPNDSGSVSSLRVAAQRLFASLKSFCA